LLYYSLTLSTDADKTRVIRIPDPIPDLDIDAIKAAIQLMAGNDIFNSEKRGAVTGAKRLELVEVTRTPFDLG